MLFTKLRHKLFPKPAKNSFLEELKELGLDEGSCVYTPHLKRTFKESAVTVTIAEQSPVEDKVFYCPLPAWFCVTGIQQSPAEVMISVILNSYNVEWYSEVAFYEFPSSRGYYRFDFLIPSVQLVIEYDGAKSHSSLDQVATDQRKDSWCWEHGITVVRFNKKHYYTMASHIDTLMKKHSIYKK